jgi:succinate dehydrogenase/fumarate reductase-like Fe-S protein
MRIEKHAIFTFKKKDIFFYFNGNEVKGKEGDMIAYALYNQGIKALSESPKLNRPRGLYCGVGTCGSCKMHVNGMDNVITCMTKLEEHMNVCIQTNKGKLHDT